MFTLSRFTGGIAQTNGYLLEVNAQHYVIDAPDGMDRWLTQRGVSVAALLLTHQHFDHVLDAEAIRTRHSCPIYAMEHYSPDLTLETLYGSAPQSQFSVTPFQVAHSIDPAQPLTVGELTWTVFHIPGHSPDSLCFYAPTLDLVFAGDVLFLDGVGRTDFPGGGWPMLAAGILRDLLPLPDATRVLPGHGPETTIARERSHNPFLVTP